jgi:hypothetical protein
VVGHILVAPEFAADYGYAGRLPFGLPASRKQPGKFGFIGEN